MNCQDYSPGIPPGPDVDCAGGTRDGPRSMVGSVSPARTRVVGSCAARAVVGPVRADREAACLVPTATRLDDGQGAYLMPLGRRA
jgi:hypothetical protein